MQLGLLVGETRLLIGSPSVNSVPDREIMSFLVPSIQWLAGHLKFSVSTDNSISLVAGQREYPLPPSLLYFCWVEVAGRLLDPTTVWALNSGGSTTSGNTTNVLSGGQGQTWRTVAPGTPTTYAVQGRQLILWPPASADFIVTTPTMAWRYLDCGAYLTNQGSVGLSPQGIPSLSALDEQVIRYDAALAWLSSHLMGQTAEAVQAMTATISAYQAEIARRLPECKRRWMSSQIDSHETVRVDTSGRYGSSR